MFCFCHFCTIQKEYLLKWDGFEDAENEWVPPDQMSSTFLVLQFETKDCHYVAGVRDENGLVYGTYGKSNVMYMVPSDFAQEMWIDAVIHFLENHIEFEMPNGADANAIQLTELPSNIGLPDEIIGEISYTFLPMFSFGRHKLVNASIFLLLIH